MRTNRTIGLSDVQFSELYERVARSVSWDKKKGRPRRLSLRQALKVTLTYFKNNITQDVLAELHGVSQPVISDAIAVMEKAIVQALGEFDRSLEDVTEAAGNRVVVVDGSLHPCWSWADQPSLWSGKHQRTGHSHQYICDLNGVLLFISDPVLGSTHDAKAFKELNAEGVFTSQNMIADKGYIGCGVLTPVKNYRNKGLTTNDEELNTFVNKHRYVIERSIANFKTWRIMHTDYRRKTSTYATMFSAVKLLHFFRMSFL